MIDAIDSRLDPAAEMEIYSTQDHSTPTYVRNTACWGNGLDLTCISPWNSQSAMARAGVLISPRHIAYAAHYPIADGTHLRFIAADGTVVTRTTTASLIHPDYSPYYPDIGISVLDSDVPDSITFASILPQDWKDYLSPSVTGDHSILGVPLLYVDKEEKLLVADIYEQTESPAAYLSGMKPVSTARQLFYESVVGGDSGDPMFMVVDGALVLLSVITGASPVGTSFVYFKDDINTMMTTLGGGYQLTEADLSGFQKV